MEKKGVLSIDVGGTSITAAVITPSLQFDQLKDIQIKKFRSLGWMNETLPEIITTEEINKINESFDEVVISGPFVVDNERNIIDPTDYYVVSKKVPSDLPKKISELIDKPVTIENDAVAWARGNLKYQRLIGKEIVYPALTVCLGTGIGLAIAENEAEIKEYNIGKSYRGSDFPNLTKTADFDYPFKDKTANKVHAILGDGFISWIKKEKTKWDFNKIKYEFTKRLVAFLYDIESNGPLKHKDVKTLFLCGGNSKYVYDSMVEIGSNIDIIYHRDDSMEINPDIIPLVGNLKELQSMN